MTPRTLSVTVIGAGLMGHGIAQVFARAGNAVVVSDPHAEVLASVKDRIAGNLELEGADADPVLRNVSVQSTLATALRDADLVIEAAPEKLPLKQQLFAEVASHAIAGADADAKARHSAQAILDRTRHLLLEAGLGDYDATHVDIIGSEACFGSNRRRDAAREAVMWLAVRHQNRKALELFAREIAPAGTSWAPGTAGGVGGRPSPSPSIKQYAFLLPKQRLAPAVVMNGMRSEVAIPVFTPGAAEADAAPTPAPSAAQMAVPAGPTVEVPLIRIAHGRSGDKGDISNIGLVARRKEWLAVLREQVTEARVKDYLSHFVKGRVTRYDPLGKSMAQILLTMPVQVPEGLL